VVLDLAFVGRPVVVALGDGLDRYGLAADVGQQGVDQRREAPRAVEAQSNSGEGDLHSGHAGHLSFVGPI